MVGSGGLLSATEFVWQELALFAGSGFLLLGISDLAVDLIWIVRATWRNLIVYRRYDRASAETLQPESPGFLAVFIPAWDESAVIAEMLRHALNTFTHDNYRIYVGCYPNDPATLTAVRSVPDFRVRLVINPRDGGTTKADNLNTIWRALLEDEVAEGLHAKAVVLHDAEDFVHCDRPTIRTRGEGRDIAGFGGTWWHRNGGFPRLPPRSGV